MNTATFLRLLENAGFHTTGADGNYIYMEDPACILRSFTTFTEYAWIFIAFITGILLFGWAISMIRGAKNDLMTNLRNLLIIFGTMTAAGPIVNFVYGDDLFARGCKTVKISLDDVNELLNARNQKLKNQFQQELYEEINIYDSGAPYNSSDTSMPDTNTSTDAPSASPNTPSTNDNGAPPGTMPNNNNATNGAIRAEMTKSSDGGRQITYIHADGTKIRRSGGTRSWRNNNPGNIVAGKFSASHGGIGDDGRFAVFPDEETGLRAIVALFRTSTYNSMRLDKALAKWAPPVENDTGKFQQNVTRWSGVSLSSYISDMTDAELMKIARAIQRNEGWVFGTEQQI